MFSMTVKLQTWYCTPKKTKISTRVRTVSGTSAGGVELSFVDQGFLTTEPNATLIFGKPQMVCSKVNEDANLDGLPRNKSFTVELIYSLQTVIIHHSSILITALLTLIDLDLIHQLTIQLILE